LLSDFSKAFNAKYLKASVAVGKNVYLLEDLQGRMQEVYHAKDIRL